MLNETKLISIGYKMYDTIYITYLKCQNYRNVEKIVGAQIKDGGYKRAE